MFWFEIDVKRTTVTHPVSDETIFRDLWPLNYEDYKKFVCKRIESIICLTYQISLQILNPMVQPVDLVLQCDIKKIERHKLIQDVFTGGSRALAAI